LVKVSKLYEEILGRYAPTANFTVTDAMTRQLSEKPYSFKTPIFTLHDRPADIFQPILDAEERLAFLKSLDITKDYVQSIREGKTKLLISSTSWTPDEDFSILLSALETYSKLYTETGLLPQLVAIITGKGPQKEMYLQRIKTLADSGKLEGVAILTAWLTTENYAKLLACADLGVCLHMSSSGVDLPMKVVDMFGAGLPVVGYGAYEAWPELVQEGVNGMGFETSSQLAGQLVKLFSSEGEELLETLREGARKEGERRWDDEWDDIAGRLFGLIEK
jgi:beta-1,4-mannosyltransferase